MMAFHLKCYGSGIHINIEQGAKGTWVQEMGGSYRDSAGPGSGYKAAGTGSSGGGGGAEPGEEQHQQAEQVGTVIQW